MVHNTDPSLSFEGGRDKHTRMWMIDLKSIPEHTEIKARPSLQVNNVYGLSVKKDIVQYLHRTSESPVTSTWYAAINNGNYTTWPGLTSANVRKHLAKSIATTKGHMRQIHQND